MNKSICFECGNSPTVSYCCCDQLYLCEKCENDNGHSEHYVLFMDLDLKNPKKIGTINVEVDSEGKGQLDIDKILEYFQKAIEEVSTKATEDIKQVQNAYDEHDLLPYEESLINYTLKINMDFFNECFAKGATPAYTYLFLRNSQNEETQSYIYKLDLNTFEGKRMEIIVPDISTPYIFQRENYLYLLGGSEGFNPVQDITRIDLSDNTVAIINRLDKSIYSFGAVMYNEFIFILGGRISHRNARIDQNKILEFNTDTEKFSDRILTLLEERYYICATIHEKYLLVGSENTYGIECMDLSSSNSTFYKIPCRQKISADSGMISAQGKLYIFNKGCIGYIEADFSNPQSEAILRQLAFIDIKIEDIWNMSSAPKCINDTIYFFGEKYAIQYSISENKAKVMEYQLDF